MKKTTLASICLGLALTLVACGGGDKKVTEPAAPEATDEVIEQAAPGTTPDVEQAKAGDVNTPAEGTYEYAYKTETTNAALPKATPRRSKSGAELRSTVSVSGNTVTTKDKSSEGSAESTLVQRWEDDRILDVSATLRSSQGAAGCKYDPPLESLHIPIAKETFPKQELRGKGVGSSRVDLQACKLEYSIVSPK